MNTYIDTIIGRYLKPVSITASEYNVASLTITKISDEQDSPEVRLQISPYQGHIQLRENEVKQLIRILKKSLNR